MASLPLGFPLPTLNRLGVSMISPHLDAQEVVSKWFNAFVVCIEGGDFKGLIELFISESYWRDILSLTWDFRTFIGSDKIKQFLKDRLPISQPKSFKLRKEYLGLQQPYPDLAWISFMFDFQVGDVGSASGVARLVPQSDGRWKAHCILSNLEELKGFPEKVGVLRNSEINHGLWTARRERDAAFASDEPVALIVGAGQAGLAVAARLKMLNVSTLIVERNQRVGDNWRNRYKALCLHDPVWANQMPYSPFPSNWPIFIPADKIAGWLEYYAEAMELNVWKCCEVTNAIRNEASNTWTVTIKYLTSNGVERVFKNIRHLIFATGFNGGQPKIPTYPGTETFKGQIIHSSQYKLASEYIGKKVVVVGACTSAHDIAADLHGTGIDVTMYQRSSTYVMSTNNGLPIYFSALYSDNSPPIELYDLMNVSFPHAFSVQGFLQRTTDLIADMDKDLLDGLSKCGFQLNKGINGTGAIMLYLTRGAGYYLDTGASQLIIDGKIKLKSDSVLEYFTETGLRFNDDSEILADVVVYATGYGDARTIIRQICGDKIADQCKDVWGLDAEGEMNGSWRDMGVPGLWYAMGNISMDRSHSKYLALQIKAMEEKSFGLRYSRVDNRIKI